MDELDEDREYASQTVLAKLIGKSARAKVLNALLSEDFHDMNVSAIAGLAGVHRTTVYDHLNELQDLGVVVQTRKVGESPMYQINHESQLAKRLKQLQEDLIEELERSDVADSNKEA